MGKGKKLERMDEVIQHQQEKKDPPIESFTEWPLFERWLFAKYPESPGTRHRHHAAMKIIMEAGNTLVKKPSFASYSYNDWESIFFELNKRKANVAQKERYRETAFLFSKYLVKRKEIPVASPIPDKDDFKFTSNGRHFNLSSITIAEVQRVFRNLSLGVTGRLRSIVRPEFDYFMVAVQVTSGLRPGAVVSLHKSFLDFSERRIQPTFDIPGFHKKKSIIVPISLAIVRDFQNYVERVPGEWVFPAPKNTTYPFINTNYFRKLCRGEISTWVGKRWHPHSGREILNTGRFLLQCDDTLREILIGHVPTGVNAQKYLFLNHNFEARRDFFDWFDPFLPQTQRKALENPFTKWQHNISG